MAIIHYLASSHENGQFAQSRTHMGGLFYWKNKVLYDGTTLNITKLRPIFSACRWIFFLILYSSPLLALFQVWGGKLPNQIYIVILHNWQV